MFSLGVFLNGFFVKLEFLIAIQNLRSTPSAQCPCVQYNQLSQQCCPYFILSAKSYNNTLSAILCCSDQLLLQNLCNPGMEVGVSNLQLGLHSIGLSTIILCRVKWVHHLNKSFHLLLSPAVSVGDNSRLCDSHWLHYSCIPATVRRRLCTVNSVTSPHPLQNNRGFPPWVRPITICQMRNTEVV